MSRIGFIQGVPKGNPAHPTRDSAQCEAQPEHIAHHGVCGAWLPTGV